MLNYYYRHLPNLAHILELLHKLLHKKTVNGIGMGAKTEF